MAASSGSCYDWMCHHWKKVTEVLVQSVAQQFAITVATLSTEHSEVEQRAVNAPAGPKQSLKVDIQRC